MRDIRRDLRDRLEDVSAERLRLERLEQSLRALLEAEELRWASPPQQASFALNGGSRSKPRRKSHAEMSARTKFLLETLADRQVWPIDLLSQTAIEKGIDFKGKPPGRVLHFVLIGMKQRKLVEQVGEGEWKLVGGREDDAGMLRQETPASLHS